MERKLASSRIISNLVPISGADFIETAVIDGWTVVVKKGEFTVGQKVCYLEIDSWVPHALAPFLSKGQEPHEYSGTKGERLKTVKLRKQLSQGLVIPITREMEVKYTNIFMGFEGSPESDQIPEGADLTEMLGIIKWETPVHPSLQGQVKGTFPVDIFSKSDQERAQNLNRSIFEHYFDDYFEITMKMDGSSISIFNTGEEVGIASRNLWLKINDKNQENTFINTTKESGLLDVMDQYPEMLFQGELMGPGIQGNREGFKDYKIFIYNIQCKGSVFLKPEERYEVFNSLRENGVSVEHVPVIHRRVKLPEIGINNMDDLKAFSDKRSMNHPIVEGFVFKSYDNDFQFKIINDKFLLKCED